MRTPVLLCLLYLMSPLAWGDAHSAQQLSKAGSRRRLLCASAMVYFDLQERSPDPRSLTAVFHHLNALVAHVVHSTHAEVLAKIRTSYRFVRAELQQDRGRAQGGAEFYLSRAVLDLDERAMTVLGEQS